MRGGRSGRGHVAHTAGDSRARAARAGAAAARASPPGADLNTLPGGGQPGAGVDARAAHRSLGRQPVVPTVAAVAPREHATQPLRPPPLSLRERARVRVPVPTVARHVNCKRGMAHLPAAAFGFLPCGRADDGCVPAACRGAGTAPRYATGCRCALLSQEGAMRRILVAVDGTRASHEAARTALEYAEHLCMQVTFVHVLPTRVGEEEGEAPEFAAFEAACEQYAAQLLRQACFARGGRSSHADTRGGAWGHRGLAVRAGGGSRRGPGHHRHPGPGPRGARGARQRLQAAAGPVPQASAGGTRAGSPARGAARAHTRRGAQDSVHARRSPRTASCPELAPWAAPRARQRQPDPEHGALPGLALHLDAATVGLDDAPGHGESQARARGHARGRRGCA